jgi:hypothetical protein
MNGAEFDFLKEAIALRAEELKLQFRSFLSDSEREDVFWDLAQNAQSLGYGIGREGINLPPILNNDSFVGREAGDGHDFGFESFLRAQYEAEYCSQQAWDKLPDKEQAEYVEEFNDLCRRGVGEDCRFYRLLMDRYLHNLVADARAHCGMGRAELLTNREIPIDRGRVTLEL